MFGEKSKVKHLGFDFYLVHCVHVCAVAIDYVKSI